MLYKVTPMLPSATPKAKEAREPGRRGRRKSAVYDANGNEVLITLMCLKCRRVKPLMQFGLRKMADGAIRNQPWCRTCRSVAGVPKDVAEVAPAFPPTERSAALGGSIAGASLEIAEFPESPDDGPAAA
jgi:hypothetical protein